MQYLISVFDDRHRPRHRGREAAIDAFNESSRPRATGSSPTASARPTTATVVDGRATGR